MTYAKIKDGLVVNVISLRKAQAHEFPDCVPADDIMVEPGDTYADGKFYRNGEELKSIAQQLAEAQEKLNNNQGETAEDEATEEDYIAALAELGVNVSEES